MRKDFGAKPLTYPQPVFIIATYDEEGTPDAMNAAWGGISEMNEISLCLSAGHKTVKNLLKRKAFTVSMAEAGKVVACDYVGLVSGNQVPDKFARAGFHAVKSAFVDAPLIEELSVATDVSTLRLSVYIVCKGAPSAQLVRRAFALWSALYLLVDDDRSIGGVVAHTRVTDMDYYPSVAAGRTQVGIEASLELQWARED